MKKLVVYYSYEGNTKFIGDSIAEKIDADVMQLKPKIEKRKKGFMKYIWGGRQIFMNKKPELNQLDKNPEDYDVIFIGTPVWAWTYTPAINTFLSEVDLKNKKIALFTCHGGQNGKTFNKMKERLKENQLIGEIDFFEPLKRGKQENENKAKDWAFNVINKI